jgi:carboxymethylenebutenolidase
MTQLQEYLASEVAEDYAQGSCSRREAMRRLALLGLGTATASALLAGFVDQAAAQPPASVGRHPRSEVVEWAPAPTEEITFPGPNGTLLGSWAPALPSDGGVLVIHENRGLNDHIRTVVGRLAASGQSALALDLLSEEGGTGAFPGSAEVAAALAAVPPERFDADMQAAVTELTVRLPQQSISAVGFCFGGAMVWRLLATGERRLAAAAPFYGPFPEGANLDGARAAVLAVYGGQDTRVNATRDAAQAAMQAARLKHLILTFTEAGHAFFNDTGGNFNPPAAGEVLRRLLDWFNTHTRAPGPDEVGQ